MKKEDYFMLCSKSNNALNITKLSAAIGTVSLVISLMYFLPVEIISETVLYVFAALTLGSVGTGVFSLTRHYKFENMKDKIKNKIDEEEREDELEEESSVESNLVYLHQKSPMRSLQSAFTFIRNQNPLRVVGVKKQDTEIQKGESAKILKYERPKKK